MRIARIALTFALALTSYACKNVECETARDCLDPLVCEDNKCVRNTGGSSGIDSGVRDLGVPDLGARPDGGNGEDSGDAEVAFDANEDAGDGGGPDGGDAMVPLIPDAGRLEFDAGTDGGTSQIVTLPSSGTIIYAELNAPEEESVELAEFYDRSLAMYSTITRSYTDFNGNPCTVTTTRFSSGSLRGYLADHVEVERTTAPVIVHPLSAVAGRPGRYEGTDPFEGRIFDTPGDYDAQIVSTNMMGELDDALATITRPAAIQTAMPVAGTPLSLLVNNPTFNFGTEASQDPLIIEAYDANREVVLHCEIPPLMSAYTIPLTAVYAFYGETPSLPAYLQISFTTTADVEIGFVGPFTSTLPTKVFAQRGVRYPLQ